MPKILFPFADLFDSVNPLEEDLDKASSFLYPAQALGLSLPYFMMWRDEFAYAIADKDGARFLLALYGRYAYLPAPPKPFTAGSLGTAFDLMRKVNGPGAGISRVEGLTGEQASEAAGWGYPTRETATEYLYDRSLVAGLQGDAFRSKRAEVNHLLREHSVVFRPYRQSDLQACGDLYEAWKLQRLPALKGQMGEKMLLSSQKAHLRALRQGEDWGMDAWVVLLEGRLAAYSAGAALAPGTYGIHLEVADLTVKGMSAYIFTNVCRQIEPYALVNTGDAEGLPGLAGSKEHWHPVGRPKSFAADPA